MLVFVRRVSARGPCRARLKSRASWLHTSAQPIPATAGGSGSIGAMGTVVRLCGADLNAVVCRVLRAIEDEAYRRRAGRRTRPLCASTVAASEDLALRDSGGFLRRLRRIARGLWRALHISVVMTPLFVTFPAMYLTRRLLPWLRRQWWAYALWSIEALGPCMVKFMQWASTRRDILPPEVCDILEPIQWQTETHPWRHTLEALATLRPDWEQVLHIDPDSVVLGSGSIAQVYRGETTVADPGDPTMPPFPRPVAVKVIHPDVKSEIEMDLELLRGAAWLAERGGYLQWWSLREFVEEFAGIMNMQLDLTREAAALDRFRENFKSSRDVVFPAPVHALTNEFVLVEDYIEGVPISAVLKSSEYPAEEKRRLAKIGLKAFLKMVFLDNFVHGDLHPGNIFVTENPANKSRPRLTFIDAGITTELTAQDRTNFIDLFYAIATGRGEHAGQLMIERARSHQCDDPEGFSKGVGRIVDEAVGSRLRLDKIRVGILIQQVLALCLRHKVQLESHFASILLAIGVLEGVGRALDPEVDILAAATPVILQSHLQSNRAPPASH